MADIQYISIKQRDGYTTSLSQFFSSKKPKGSILILHGMAEHQERYYDFVNYLINLEFDVYIYDHRGHGKSTKINNLGFISSDNGFNLIIEDAINISNYIEKNNRSKKFFLFGHSMGSLLARNVIQTYQKYNGVILSGTTMPPTLILKSGLILSSIIKKFKGPKYISPFLNNLLFGSKKYTRLSHRTAFDWLTRSNPIVGAYINDPYCGFICTVSFYHDLIKLTSNASNKKKIRQTKHELPIYIISGEFDPVGSYGKEIKKFIILLKKLGFSNISSKLYPECRHEILNELNHEEVYNDIYHWILKRI